MTRQFVIADIHGCSRTFRQLLFSVIKLERSDTLFLLGDYIDRGADSKGVIETILELQRNKYDVRPILGNHDEMLITSIETGVDLELWLDNGGDTFLKSYGIELPEDVPDEHLDFIKKLPLYLMTDKYIFVHAGLDFTLDDPLKETPREYILWDRTSKRVDLSKTGGRKVVAGHNLKHIDNIVKSLKTNFIQLDNGCFLGSSCKGKGKLVALELNSGELSVQENIDQTGDSYANAY